MKFILRLILVITIGAIVPLLFIIAKHYKEILKTKSIIVLPEETPILIIFWFLGSVVVYILLTLKSSKETNSG